MLTAFLVLALVSGRRGVRELWQQMTRWRVGWRWYVVAPGIMDVAGPRVLTRPVQGLPPGLRGAEAGPFFRLQLVVDGDAQFQRRRFEGVDREKGRRRGHADRAGHMLRGGGFG